MPRRKCPEERPQVRPACLQCPTPGRRRIRSQIPGWAQGVYGHPRLVPKSSKETRKAIDTFEIGHHNANDAINSDTVRAPPVIR